MNEQINYTLQEIEEAKNFIWNKLPTLTKEFIIFISQMDDESRQAKYIRKFDCHLEGKIKDNVIVKEFAVLSLGEIQKNSI